VIATRFPPDLTSAEISVRQFTAPSSPECIARYVLDRPSTVRGVPFVDVRDEILASTPPSGSYHLVGAELEGLPYAAQSPGAPRLPCE
jgi:hypothetical protein